MSPFLSSLRNRQIELIEFIRSAATEMLIAACQCRHTPNMPDPGAKP
jgi:hypothetical protein